MKTSFLMLDTPESLRIVRDIAGEVWPKTFAPILPPEVVDDKNQFGAYSDIAKIVA